MDLTNQEKLSIIGQHLKNLLMSQYNLNLQLGEANVSATPNKDVVSNLQSQIDDLQLQINYLNSQSDTMQTITP